MRYLFAIMALGLLAGCGSKGEVVYTRADGSPSSQYQLEADNARCRNESLAIAAMNPYATAYEVHQNCMTAMGWRVKAVY